MSPVLLSSILILAGLFTVAGAVLDWSFFMNSRKAAMFVSLFGRNGARTFYVVLGAALVVFGVVNLFTAGP